MQIMPFTKYPLLPVFCLASGMFVAIFACLFTPYSPPLLLIVIIALLVFLTLFWGKFLLCGLMLGILAVGLNAPMPYQKFFEHCQFEAQISRPNYSNRLLGQEVRLFADNIICVDATLPPQTLQYWDNSRELSQLIGQRLQVSANLIPIHSRLNPLSFDYEKYLLAENLRLSVKQLKIIDTVPEKSWLLNSKNHVSQDIITHLSPANTGIIIALLTGNRTALSPEQKQTMQATGTSHLLAISGLHLALVGGVFWLFFQCLWALSWRLSDWISPRHAGAVAALCAITFYAIFTGFDVPVKRAWVMFSLLILSWLLGRGLANSSLLLAACAVMFVSPYAVVSVGFYFSFIATFVVLWSSRLPYSPLVRVLLMQALINLTLLPITWYTFGVVSLSAFFVNVLVIPWLGLWVLPWAIVATLLTACSPMLAAPIWTLLDTTTAMLWQTIAVADAMHWTFYPDNRPAQFIAIGVIAAVIVALISGKRWLFATMLLLLLPPLSHPSPALLVADRRYTSALIHNGHTAILINAGRRYRHINDAAMWQRYLRQNGLQLGAIILENDKLTRISATKWLLDQFPTTRVITLEKFPLPYSAQFCQSLTFDNLHLVSTKNGEHCRAKVHWQGQVIELFPQQPQNPNALLPKATLRWKDKTYIASTSGAISVQQDRATSKVTFLRQQKRLWRNEFKLE